MYDARGRPINSQQVLRYGDIFIIKNLHTNSVLSRGGGNTAMSHSTGTPVHLYAVSATDETRTLLEEPVRTNEEIILRTMDGLFFERKDLLYPDEVWGGGRFALGFVPAASFETLATDEAANSQTCVLSTESDVRSIDVNAPGKVIPYSADIGVSFGGSSYNPLHCCTTNRRYLTLRPSDLPTCVVTAFNTHEKLRLECIAPGKRERNWRRRRSFLVFLSGHEHNFGTQCPSSVRTVLYLHEMVRYICSYL